METAKGSQLKGALADSGFVGLGKIIGGSSLPGYRLIWAGVILAALAFNGWHLGTQIVRFCERETTLATSLRLNDSVVFPSLLFMTDIRGDGEQMSDYTINLTACSFAGAECRLRQNFTITERNHPPPKLNGNHTTNLFGFNNRSPGRRIPNASELVPARKASLFVEWELRRRNESVPCAHTLARHGLHFKLAVAAPEWDVPGMRAFGLAATQWHVLRYDYANNMMLQVRHTKRLPPPYSNCAEDYSESMRSVLNDRYTGSSAYNLDYCQQVCDVSVDLDKCGCLQNDTMDYYANDTFFSVKRQSRCAVPCEASNENARQECRDQCLPGCEDFAFDVLVTNSYNFFEESCDRIAFHANLAYPDSGLYTEIVENEAYELVELLNDAGSLINFYLGLSVAVVAEAVVLVIAAYVDRKNADQRKLSRSLLQVIGRRFSQRVLVEDLLQDLRKLQQLNDSNSIVSRDPS